MQCDKHAHKGQDRPEGPVFQLMEAMVMGARTDPREIWEADPQDLMWKVKRGMQKAPRYEFSDEQGVRSA